MQRSEYKNIRKFVLFAKNLVRILDNQHLLDATEIFRKLNVHKKVLGPPSRSLRILN
jgi:hypothetical protein